MRRRALIGAFGMALALGAGATVARLSAVETIAPGQRLSLGVNTHFGQGWPDRFRGTLDSVPVAVVRDGVAWRLIEPTPGAFSFTDANSGHVAPICQGGRRAMLVLLPRHPAYDGGFTVYTAAARGAFARYVLALAERFADCLAAVQIGNEVNAGAGMTGPAAADRARSYTAILQDVHAAVKPRHPDLLILGGSTNAIGTGFLSKLFAAGALAFMDGVVVHPYRRDATGVDWELERLKAAMRAHGGEKPIWANEFGFDTADRRAAADHLIQMVALTSGAGVAHASWYALADQRAFPNFGLFDIQGGEKPAAGAFRLAADLLVRGDAVRIAPDATELFLFRFGADRHVLWGNRRAFSVTGAARFRDASGAVVAKPAFVGDSPIVIEGDVEVALGPQLVLADSLTHYGRAPWRYLGQRGANPPLALGPIDWTWSSFIGHANLKPAAINMLGVVPAGAGTRAIRLTSRYTADRARDVIAVACLSKPAGKGDGVAFTIAHNGAPAMQKRLTGGAAELRVAIAVAVGDHVDFTLDPLVNSTGDATAHRLRVVTDPHAAPC